MVEDDGTTRPFIEMNCVYIEVDYVPCLASVNNN